jgi:hypothetical protein
MVLTIRQTQEFRPITASNDETVSVPVVLLLCLQISLPCGLCAAVLCAKLEKPVLFEALQEFTNVAFDNVSANTEFAADFIDHLGFGATALQHFKDFRTHKIEGEHLPVMDVENDSPVAVVSAPHSFGYLQQGVPLFPVIPGDSNIARESVKDSATNVLLHPEARSFVRESGNGIRKIL